DICLLIHISSRKGTRYDLKAFNPVVGIDIRTEDGTESSPFVEFIRCLHVSEYPVDVVEERSVVDHPERIVISAATAIIPLCTIHKLICIGFGTIGNSIFQCVISRIVQTIGIVKRRGRSEQSEHHAGDIRTLLDSATARVDIIYTKTNIQSFVKKRSP